ncbi:MAG: hypothetical protein U0521_01785 [Anaerolineae bacterium]
MMVVRVALTGRTNTPDLYEILQAYGKRASGSGGSGTRWQTEFQRANSRA